jgi:hypothetical protein
MTETEYLARVGTALYGPFWQSELGRAIDVDPRTVRRWASGEFNIPIGVWAELSALITEREIELRALRSNMPRPRLR